MKIKLTKAVADKIKEHHLQVGKKTEALSFLYGHTARNNSDTVILLGDPENVKLLDDDCYESKGYGNLTIPASVKGGAYWMSVSNGFNATVDLHDHHFSNQADHSIIDDRDDIKSSRWWKNSLMKFDPNHSEKLLISMVIGQQDWSARRVVWDEAGRPIFEPVDVLILDENLGYYTKKPSKATSPFHLRHKQFMPEEVQNTISSLKLGIVGMSGTGSISIEDALRSGFKDIVIVDDDEVEIHNLNRIQGFGANDIGKSKVEVAKHKYKLLFPNVDITAINAKCYQDEARNELKSCDVIIGNVDNNETRWYLNRLCLLYMIPYFDVGVVINGSVPPVFTSRLNVVIPGLTACGHCSAIRFFERKTPDSFLDATTVSAQRAAGYITNQSAQVAAPSAYVLNQQAVSNLFMELMNWIAGWNPLTYTIVQRSNKGLWRLNRKDTTESPAEDCPICNHILGKGDAYQLPEQGIKIENFDRPNPTGATDYGQV